MKDYILRKTESLLRNGSQEELTEFRKFISNSSVLTVEEKDQYNENLKNAENKFSKKEQFCYWSIGDGNHGLMLKSMIQSARNVGVKEDFHVWTDIDIDIHDVHTHKCGNFNKDHYLFKFKFLQEEVQALDYEYFVFLDADNLFVRHPGDFTRLIENNKIFCQLENMCNAPNMIRKEWWGCSIDYYPLLLWYHGVKSKTVWNTNAGFWIIKKKYVEEFCKLVNEFWIWCKDNIKVLFTEEAPLAFAGHMMQTNLEQSTLRQTSDVWASDWTGHFEHKLPTGLPWEFEDYMTGEKTIVNPAIVHVMRSKELLI